MCFVTSYACLSIGRCMRRLGGLGSVGAHLPELLAACQLLVMTSETQVYTWNAPATQPSESELSVRPSRTLKRWPVWWTEHLSRSSSGSRSYTSCMPFIQSLRLGMHFQFSSQFLGRVRKKEAGRRVHSAVYSLTLVCICPKHWVPSYFIVASGVKVAIFKIDLKINCTFIASRLSTDRGIFQCWPSIKSIFIPSLYGVKWVKCCISLNKWNMSHYNTILNKFNSVWMLAAFVYFGPLRIQRKFHDFLFPNFPERTKWGQLEKQHKIIYLWNFYQTSL